MEKYRLPTSFDNIKTHSPTSWKNIVSLVIEEENLKRLQSECYKTEDGIKVPKTKTHTIIDKISNEEYKRSPEHELLHMTKHETKTVIIARYGMLECGKNYKWTQKS